MTPASSTAAGLNSGSRSQVSGFVSRRQALRTLAAATALPLLGTRSFAAGIRPETPQLPPRFTLGAASISLKSLPLANMLEATKRLGLGGISLHRAHSPWENQPAQWKEIAGQVRAAGVQLLCCGVLYLKNDESDMRRLLDYARAHGVTVFSCSPEPAALPLLEKLVKEYDLRAAIHNHGPEDKSWPSVQGVMSAIAALDPRIGLCLDIGHCYRSGEDPVEMIYRHKDRLYDVHLKDILAAPGDPKDQPVEMGRGRLDLHAIVSALGTTRYAHGAWLEYEKDANDPLPGLAESTGYIRGLMRAMG
jgi:inosose dehydratase